MQFSEDFIKEFKGDVDDSPRTLEKYSEDTSIFHLQPEVVVYPKDVADLATLIHYTHRHRGQMSLTARSAGTDMSGGPLTTSIVVDFLRYFNKIKQVDEKHATTEPGVFYRDFEPETLKYGALLPSYTASRELNTVGGMVANNSAGEKSLTYGKTERYVHSLKVVLQDGVEYEFKKLSRPELEAKKSQSDYEGEIYRRVEDLIHQNTDTIKANRPTVNKNSAGYGIWNVWDKEADTFDLTQLFVGSQGTLGFISEITFDLVQPKNESRMLVMFLRPKHWPKLGEIINTVLKYKPESFESYDDKTFGVMLRVFPKLFKRLGGNIFKLARDFWPETRLILTGGIPKLVLMAEFVGDDDKEVANRARTVGHIVGNKYDIPIHVTANKEEANKFWLIRRESFKLLRENVKGKHTAPFIDDLSVEPKHLPEFLPRLYKILDEYKLIYTVAGHVGDGNFHIIPLMDFSRPDFIKIINELSDRVYTLVGEYHGSITGEHNDGLIRTPYLNKMFTPKMLDVFLEIKEIFDPHRIFNPHKKVDADISLLTSAVKKVTPK
ncbi:MAG: FAD-binding oxidoreductase [Candidatus Nomurabacteria bacterium]|nr:FAD-binding oxidoreductase [Candidatus Nomurabacteria bacterium]USN87637.1 MAG: FAD-binding oxidoreductase [Candidatus Nomurabacteria bacterium]